MNVLMARVRGGRLTLDEPTDLPEGSVVDLVAIDEVLDGDDPDEEERARLHAAIDRGLDDARAGRVTDARAVVSAFRGSGPRL